MKKHVIDLLTNITLLDSKNLNPQALISAVEIDSRKVTADTLFVAIRGTQADGHSFIPKAIELGATVILCQQMPEVLHDHIAYLCVEHPSKALGEIASAFYDYPSTQMKVIGVTGTNGKTSIATLLYQLFQDLGEKCGLLSTINIRINGQVTQATHTTPDAVSVQRNMKAMVDAGCSYCFMEVSSHAVDQDRISGIEFDGAIFTNITHDHLDYHLTFANYIQAKKKFFDQLNSNAFAITNIDDRNGRVMVQNCSATIKTYAIHQLADYSCRIIENSIDGLILKYKEHELYTQLRGEFNAYNILAVIAVAEELEMPLSEVMLGISKLKPVEGRFDTLESPIMKIKGVIDYAHTPDAVEKLLKETQKAKKANGKVITVIGCGGDRDREKRPKMASVAVEYSDKVILTADNPRSEDPRDIIADMKEGLDKTELKKILVVIDRKEAINTACHLANKEDIIVIAGKGHEKYQEINGSRFPFDDMAVLRDIFSEFNL
jgi:UDP-N-acetylmuramoyl-L-alanyl-D-glutamate--2,6-diaminopimelate ligase